MKLVDLVPINEGSMQARELADRNSLQQLQAMYDQLMRDMEQEAEPEGGPIADMYGQQMQDIEDAMQMKRGKTKDVPYDVAIGRMSRDEFEKSSKFGKMQEEISDDDMLRSFQKNELLDDLGDIVAKYVKDPDDIDRELDRFDIGGIDAMSNLVTANLLRDPEYQAWAKKFNRIKESNDVRKVIKKMIKEQSFDDRLKSMMGTGDFEKATTPQMPEATKVWDALVKTFSDNKNDSISYLNSDKTYRSIAIREIFRAMNF